MDILHDSLTGLYNKHFFDEELERLSKTRGIKIGVIICDIENFDEAHMKYSPSERDKITLGLASMLKTSFRESDIIARTTEEEFGILLEDVSEDLLVEISKRILEKVESFNKISTQLPMSVYVGWSLSDNSYGDVKKAFYDAGKNKKKE